MFESTGIDGDSLVHDGSLCTMPQHIFGAERDISHTDCVDVLIWSNTDTCTFMNTNNGSNQSRRLGLSRFKSHCFKEIYVLVLSV